MRAAGVGRWYGFSTCVLLVLPLRLGPTYSLNDVGSPVVLVPTILALEPPGATPECRVSPEAVRLAWVMYEGAWKEGPSVRENVPAGVACVGEVYGRH
jgi:hypothetical protein